MQYPNGLTSLVWAVTRTAADKSNRKKCFYALQKSDSHCYVSIYLEPDGETDNSILRTARTLFSSRFLLHKLLCPHGKSLINELNTPTNPILVLIKRLYTTGYGALVGF